MRWKVEPEQKERIKTWFALVPVSIGDDIRWLETVTVKQRKEWQIKHTKFGPRKAYDYSNISFVDKKEN